jgi:hypothetical protein
MFLDYFMVMCNQGVCQSITPHPVLQGDTYIFGEYPTPYPLKFGIVMSDEPEKQAETWYT